MGQLPHKVEINIAAIPVRGFGGLCLVIVSLVATATIPATRWFMLAGIVTGIAVAVGLIWKRRRRAPEPPRRGGPILGEQPLSPRDPPHANGLGRLRTAHR